MASSFSRWLRRAVTTLFLLVVIAFGLMMPADCIIQASNSPNDALNTFIVVGAVAFIIVMCILLGIGRVLIHRSCMQDIPKRYVPITDRDLLHNGCMEEITKHMNLAHELTKEFKKPATRVVHDGMEPPLSADYVHDDKIPPLLNYETCVKIVADRFKFQGVFINNAQLLPSLSSTFSQQVQSQFLTHDGEYLEQTQKYIELYEAIRFSGRPITREQLIQFMELSLFFFDLSVTMDNKPAGYVAEVPNFVSLTTRTDSNISDTSSDYRTTADMMGSSEWALHNSSTNETVTMNLTFPYNRGGAAGASEVVLEFRNSSSLESMQSVIRR